MDLALAHGFGYGMGFNPFFAFFGFIFNLLFFALFIAGIFWLLRMLRRGGWGRHGGRGMRYAGGRGDWWRGGNDAVDTARERFAKGEISKEQYDAIKAGLEAEQAKEGDWRPPFMRRDDALEIARMRFAKGEITQEQYEEIKRGLS